MRIVHIAPNAPYNEGWGYQENLLTKYQAKSGNDVTLIITTKMHKDGRIINVEEEEYISKDGVRVIRRGYTNYLVPCLTNLCSHISVLDLLIKIQPDFIFFHGLVSTTIYDVIEYKKKYLNCIIVQDNHLDYNIGSKSKTYKEKIRRGVYRYINKKSIPYIECVYGVTPWRKKYAEEYFQIPKDKTDILIMGADDEKIDFKNRDFLRESVRKKHNITNEDFLIVTGGKIDEKKKIHYLMEACLEMKNVKLLIFGQVHNDVRKLFENLLKKNNNIIYIGWIAADKVYEYFFAADLVFFPGQHSVLWEQACASKVPCVFERWEGMEHVNNGGNSDFVSTVNVQTIKKKIQELFFTEKYFQMKKVALSNATDIYLYSNITKKSLECLRK